MINKKNRYFSIKQNFDAMVIRFNYLLIICTLFLLLFAPPPVNAKSTMPNSKEQCTVLRALIVLVQFPDVERKIEADFVKRRFFQDLNVYVQEMSYGKFCIGGNATKRWYTLPRNISEYRISPRNLNVDKSRVRRLVKDTLKAADPDVDFSQYDFVVFFMAAERKDYGMIGMCAYPGMLGWSDPETLMAPSGERINHGIALFTYQAHLGTLFHDVAHVLGGVESGKRMMPCLYDHDLQSRPSQPNPLAIRRTFLEAIIYMGFWDPMSCHFYKWSEPPPGISSWTKIRLGWIDPSKIKIINPEESSRITLGPLEDGGSQTLVIKIPLTNSTYYLIENRQPLGFDQNLPGNGILIMHADDSIAECRHGRGPVSLINADPKEPYLQGASFDFGKNESFIDDKNGVQIKLVKKEGYAYEMFIVHKKD